MQAILLSICLPLACAHPPPTRGPEAAVSPVAKPSPFAVTLDFKPEQTRAPAGIWLRVKSPAAVLPRLIGLAGEPSLRGYADLHALSGLVLGGELSSLLDLDAPLSAVFARETETVVIAARLMNEARFEPEELGEKLHARGPGRWGIRPSDGGERLSCELWHVAAPVGYRILCAAKGTDLAPFAPFLLGQLEKTTPTGDVKVVATHFPLAARPDLPKLAVEGESVFSARLSNSLDRAETIGLELNFREPDIELALELAYGASDVSAGVRGWIAGTPSALPPQFWRTVSVAPIAFASAGADEETTNALLSDPILGGLFAAFNPASAFSPEAAERVVTAMGGFIPERLRFTMSLSGAVPTAARQLAGRPSRRRKPREDAANACWTLMGFAGSGERYLKGLAALEEASNVEPAGAQAANSAVRLVRLRKMPPDLPHESVIFRQQCSDKSNCFSWVWPGRDWVWVLAAASEAQLIAEVRRVLPSLVETPASNDGSEATTLLNERSLLGMSSTLAGLTRVFRPLASDLDPSTLPFGGSARIFASVSGAAKQVDGTPTVALRLTSRWSPAATADLVALIKGAQKPAGEPAP